MAAIVNRLDLESTDDWLAFAPYEVQISAILDAIHDVGDESEEMATISHLLGRWFLVQGKNQEAKQHFTKALEIRRRLLPGDHPDTARTLNYLGDALRYLKQNEEGKAYLKEAYKMRKRLYQGDHTEVAASLLNMALLYNRVTEFEKKMRYTNRSIDMWRRIYSNGHRLIALALTNKAYYFEVVNNLDEAYAFAFEALQMLESICHGNDSKNVLTMAHVLHVLGRITGKQGKKDDTLSYSMRAVEIYEKINPCHPRIADCFQAIGNLLVHIGSIAYFTQYIDANTLPGNEHNLGVALYFLGLMNYILLKYEIALDQLTRSLSLLGKAIEGDDLNKFAALGHIGVVYQDMGNHQEAVVAFRLAIEMGKRLGSKNTRGTFRFLFHMGNSLKALGRNQEAHECFAESTAIEQVVSPQAVPPPSANRSQRPVPPPRNNAPPPEQTGCFIL